MSLPFLLGALTLTPMLCALLIALLGVARFALKPLALALGGIGLLVPVMLLLILLPELAPNNPYFVSLFGASAGLNNWFSAIYRLDGFGVYAAMGISVVIAPLLFWMAWKGAETGIDETTDATDVDEADSTATEAAAPTTSWMAARLATAQWGGVALALGIESAALTLVFADNILWLALSWLILVALAWGIGELGSDLDTVDRVGLGLMLVGPVLWALVLLIPASGQTTNRTIYAQLTDMMGRNGLVPLQVLALAIVLTLAGAGYPFMVWLRRRALLVTPAGLTVLLAVLLPMALFVGARTYSAAQAVGGSWQQIGQTTPPITAGIWFSLLGMLTVCVAGLLALGRRDSRTLVAFLAIAQVGWGLLALGAGNATSMLGLMTLLATSLLGLGAMLAALFAGGTLTSDIELDGAGPRPFGMPVQPLNLLAWVVGALTLLGMPLFGGFVARQMISASIVEAKGLAVPLIGIAWAGDALLGLALLRATAPAFTVMLGSLSKTTAVTTETTDASETADDNEATDASESVSENAPLTLASLLPQLPAILLGVAALLVGALPQLLLNIGVLPAASALVPDNAANIAFTAKTFGYLLGAGYWIPGVAWVAIIILVLLILFALPTSLRETRPVYLAGASAEQALPAVVVPVAAVTSDTLAASPEADEEVAVISTAEEEATSAELNYLPEPAAAWSDIAGVFSSSWLLPFHSLLLRGVDDEAESLEDESEDESMVDEAAEDEELDEVYEPDDIDDIDDIDDVDEEEALEEPELADDEEYAETDEGAEAEEVDEADEPEEVASAPVVATAAASEEPEEIEQPAEPAIAEDQPISVADAIEETSATPAASVASDEAKVEETAEATETEPTQPTSQANEDEEAVEAIPATTPAATIEPSADVPDEAEQPLGLEESEESDGETLVSAEEEEPEQPAEVADMPAVNGAKSASTANTANASKPGSGTRTPNPSNTSPRQPNRQQQHPQRKKSGAKKGNRGGKR